MKDKYRRMIRTMRSMPGRMRVRPFLHPKSRHTFSVHQHVITPASRQYEPGSHGSFAEWPGAPGAVCRELGLPHIPHFTTLQKAAARLGTAMLHLAVGRFTGTFCPGAEFAGIDATGLGTRHAGSYCAWRTGCRHEYARLSACPGMRTQLAMAARAGPRGRRIARAGAASADGEGGRPHGGGGQGVRRRMGARGSQALRRQGRHPGQAAETRLQDARQAREGEAEGVRVGIGTCGIRPEGQGGAGLPRAGPQLPQGVCHLCLGLGDDF